MICKKQIRRSTTWLYRTYFEKIGENNLIFVGKKGKNKEEKLTLFQIQSVSIKWHVLCKVLNAYDPASVKYFHKRNVNRSKNVCLNRGTKSALTKLQKDYCPVCDLSLFNDEDLEIHHHLASTKKR
jgi:hypothetical protein